MIMFWLKQKDFLNEIKNFKKKEAENMLELDEN